MDDRSRLKKSLGQYILRDREFTRRIAQSLPTAPLTLEIGPGDGALTSELLELGHRVIGVELDPVMVERLQRRFQHRRDFTLIPGDILKIDWQALSELAAEIVIVGNLPYHLASAILFSVFKIVRQGGPPLIRQMVAMVQREVGLRLTAAAGGKAYGSLTLLTLYHARPEYLFTVPAESFRPRPKVDGAVIQLTFQRREELPAVDWEPFRRVVRSSFAQRRKMMRNTLQVMDDLPEGWNDLDYDFTKRPEQFTFDDYIHLTRDLLQLKEKTAI